MNEPDDSLAMAQALDKISELEAALRERDAEIERLRAGTDPIHGITKFRAEEWQTRAMSAELQLAALTAKHDALVDLRQRYEQTIILLERKHDALLARIAGACDAWLWWDGNKDGVFSLRGDSGDNAEHVRILRAEDKI